MRRTTSSSAVTSCFRTARRSPHRPPLAPSEFGAVRGVGSNRKARKGNQTANDNENNKKQNNDNENSKTNEINKKTNNKSDKINENKNKKCNKIYKKMNKDNRSDKINKNKSNYAAAAVNAAFIMTLL